MCPSRSQRVGVPQDTCNHSADTYWAFTICLALSELRDKPVSKPHTPALIELMKYEPSKQRSTKKEISEELRAEGVTVGGWMSFLEGSLTFWVEFRFSLQGWQDQNHIVTVVEPLLPQPEAPCAFVPQVQASPEVLLVVLPDSPR